MNHYCYVPLREAPDPASPIRLLVGVDENNMSRELAQQDDGSVVVRGMLERRLQSQVRYQFEKYGSGLPSPCWILFTTRKPASDEKVGAIPILAPFVVGLIWALRRSRRFAKPLPLRAPLSAKPTRP